MRRLSTVRAGLVVLAAALALAVAPTAGAASTDLINTVQQVTGGTLPSDTASLTNIANQLAASGLVGDTDPNSVLAKLKAISSRYTGADTQTVSEILASGLTASQIDAFGLTSANQQYMDALSQLSGSISPDSSPTGTQLKPLTDALRSLSGPADATGVLNTLAGQIDAVGNGVVPPELLNQLTAVLRLIGQAGACATNPNDPSCPLAGLLKALLPSATTASKGSVTPVGAPATPVPVVLPAVTPFTLTLKVVKVKLTKNHARANVTVKSSAPTALLPVGFAVTYGKKAAAKPVLFNLPTGRNVTKKVTIKRAIVKTLNKKGGTLKVVPAFNVPGIASVPSLTINQLAKSVKVRKPHRTRR